MEARGVRLMKLLDTNIQFVVPVYQRTYSWTHQQCERLWADILAAADMKASTGHFIGSIVYMNQRDFQPGQVTRMLLIDGQQRLTTISLLLEALARGMHTRNPDDPTPGKIRHYFLHNHLEQGDAHNKLMLARKDQETFRNILDGSEENTPATAHRLLDNFDFFRTLVDKHTDLDKVYRGINMLDLVYIALEKGVDNPQRIFESMNSTGLDLTQSDLIRNYILMEMNLREQDRLYRKYWYPIEHSLGQNGYQQRFDLFIRCYLTLRTNVVPVKSNVYEEFKAWHYKTQLSKEQVLASLAFYAVLYTRIAMCADPDKVLNQYFIDLRELHVESVYPFLMRVYADCLHKQLSREELIDVLKLTTSYILRRNICGLSGQSFTKTFSTFHLSIDPNNYVDSVRAEFLVKSGCHRFPTDKDFAAKLKMHDLYHSGLRNYVLRHLENHEHKEPFCIDDYTVEHIMPQNTKLSEAWQRELGEGWHSVQAKYLHTIGNLTLTGYNSELSDHPFQMKKTMPGGYAHSHLKLNKLVAQADTWNQEAITKRAENLSALAVAIWPYPSASKTAIAKLKVKSKTATQNAVTLFASKLSTDAASAFTDLRKRILNIDPSVFEEYEKSCFEYKVASNFVSIVNSGDALEMYLNVSIDQLDDPGDKCRDISEDSSYLGAVSMRVGKSDDVEYAMNLVRQAYGQQVATLF